MTDLTVFEARTWFYTPIIIMKVPSQLIFMETTRRVCDYQAIAPFEHPPSEVGNRESSSNELVLLFLSDIWQGNNKSIVR